jgi:hypothetical protein
MYNLCRILCLMGWYRAALEKKAGKISILYHMEKLSSCTIKTENNATLQRRHNCASLLNATILPPPYNSLSAFAFVKLDIVIS